jgi:predicted small secreted protein
MSRLTTVLIAILLTATLTAGCSNTWQGVKKDTSKTLQKTGDALSDTGKKMD